LKKLWRIPIIIVSILALVAVIFFWAGPVALSIWTVRKVPSRAWLAPVELTDASISPAAGSKLSYFGYEFELPWSDIDASRSKADLKLNRAVITLRSGLQVSVTALPPKDFINAVASSYTSPQLFEPFVASEFGSEASRSDYEFLRRLYNFTPEKMDRWALSSAVHYRESMLLTIKSAALLPWAADSGIFNVRNAEYRGFQQGRPDARPTGIAVTLFSEDGGIEFIFSQTSYGNPAGVSQAEINRVIQSVRKMGEGRGQTGVCSNAANAGTVCRHFPVIIEAVNAPPVPEAVAFLLGFTPSVPSIIRPRRIFLELLVLLMVAMVLCVRYLTHSPLLDRSSGVGRARYHNQLFDAVRLESWILIG
jgi:hypothetical protein